MKLSHLSIAATLLLICSVCVADDAPISEGIWHQKIRMLIARADIFTSLRDDGTCFQIGQGRAFGTIQWMYMECTWSATSEELTLTVTRSPGVDNMTGRSIGHQILSANSEQILLRQGDEEQEWSLIEALPEEFEEKLQEYLNHNAR